MNLIIPLNEIRAEDRDQVGGKASSLATMIRMGLNVPDALCVKAEAYNHYSTVTGEVARAYPLGTESQELSRNALGGNVGHLSSDSKHVSQHSDACRSSRCL